MRKYIILMVAFIVLAPLAVWGFRVATAEIKGRGDARIEIQSGQNRIVQYEHFFDLCVSVQNAEVSLDAEYDRLEQETDSNVRSRILANISGLHAVRMNGVHTYNADAKKNYTDAQFLASNLPYQIPTHSYERGGTKTTCAI